MRSAVVLGLAVLTGCEDKSGTPYSYQSGDPAISEAPVSAQQALPSLAPASPPASVVRLQVLGTEPFWSIEINGDTLRYSSPENPNGTEFAATQGSTGMGTRYFGTLDGKPLSLLIEPGQCSDGMSEAVYPLSAMLSWGTATQHGCARPK
jgi:uncharacterized membrane protein